MAYGLVAALSSRKTSSLGYGQAKLRAGQAAEDRFIEGREKGAV
jgi:hypothetical protein